jgi:hypothetical protein
MRQGVSLNISWISSMSSNIFAERNLAHKKNGLFSEEKRPF